MLRALSKGGMLFAFGRTPGGTQLYRELTRSRMGTQATHVDKLQRVWPGYVAIWRERCGLQLEGARIWVHEAGWTPFPLFVNYLLTGKAGSVTNSEARILDRYVARAVNGALAAELPADLIPNQRRDDIEKLRWASTAEEAIGQIGGAIYAVTDPGEIPLPACSVDLCHSGGALEHYRPDRLRAFLAECLRVLKPGGIASHVFDHRDHLYHADKRIPFLAHLAIPDLVYTPLLGHPLAYHSRLLPSEVAAIFEATGFERVTVRRMILPSRAYVEREEDTLVGAAGIERRWLRPRFRHASEADLRTAAAHYLYRKPD